MSKYILNRSVWDNRTFRLTKGRFATRWHPPNLSFVCQVFADVQRKCLKRVYPQAKLIHIQGADRHMISKKASSVSKHLLELVSKRQTKHAMRQWHHRAFEHRRVSCLETINIHSCAASSDLKKIKIKISKNSQNVFFCFETIWLVHSFKFICQMFAVICGGKNLLYFFLEYVLYCVFKENKRHQVYPED